MEDRALNTVKPAARRTFIPRKKLGEVLIETGLITVQHLTEALKLQKDTGKRLGDILIEKKFISEEEMAFALALQLKIEYIDLSEHTIEQRIIEIIPRETAVRFACVGISINNNILEVAMADPRDLNMIKDLQFITGYNIKPAISTASQIQDILQKHYNPVKSLSDVTKEFENDEVLEFLPEEKKEEEETHSAEEFKDSPFVKMVDLIIRNAIKRGASDVHIEAQENHVRVRNRIDGVLQDSMPKLPKWTQPIIISRIKVLGGMDISERRLPQDGRIKVRSKNMSVDLRVSTLPTYYGEKAVIRILNKDETSLKIKDLGLNPRSYTTISSFINQPQGMILFTG
ncbi:MAG: Flp pilus assembly complex ATPase component TadA, partial [Deltaproteobacteria bacterium]|nr:Flp pilus assembly complex ATPase component TadA [Deltaproteobacteria bacterium]